jgi:hypothetical protein
MSKNSLPSSGGMGVEVALGSGVEVAVGSTVAVVVGAVGAGAQAERVETSSAVITKMFFIFMAALLLSPVWKKTYSQKIGMIKGLMIGKVLYRELD